MWYVIKDDELYHHGIKGQKWGVRRFQNPDGTLTAEGKKRYNQYSDGAIKKKSARTKRIEKRLSSSSGSNRDKLQKKLDRSVAGDRNRVAKNLVKAGAAAAVTGLAIYGAYKLSQMNGSNSVSELKSIGEDSVAKYIRKQAEEKLAPEVRDKVLGDISRELVAENREYYQKHYRELYDFDNMEQKYDRLPRDVNGTKRRYNRVEGNAYLTPEEKVKEFIRVGLININKEHFDRRYEKEMADRLSAN